MMVKNSLLRYLLSLTFVSGLLIVWSCTKETETIDPATYGYDYYPLQVGKFWIYKSDSIVLSSGGTIRDTLAGYLKEEVDNFEINAEGDSSYQIKKYFKRLFEDEWQYQKTIFVNKNNQKITRQEDNLVFTKMVFPVQKGVRFNHNQYFDPFIDIMVGGEVLKGMYSDWNTRFERIDNPLVWQGNQVKNVEIRLVEDNSTSLEKKYYYETYIKGIGLYSKNMIFLQDNKGGTQPIEERAIKGFYHDLVLLEHN